MKKLSAMIISVILFLSLTTFTVTSVASPLQVTRLMEKPSWAGSPGGPNGGDDEEDPTVTYVLNIEIDYMVGYAPTPGVLAYIDWYYEERGIDVAFYIDQEVPYDASVNDEEFWAIEAEYNDNLGDDSAGGNPESGVYTSEWKWVLFGSTVEGESDVVGYCWVVISGKDYVAGNYLFIADETADDWASSEGIEFSGAEAVILMHEMGHSIGIGKLHPVFGEKYDSDAGSVMSYLSEANAGLYDIVDEEILGHWYYSDEYWATRNMDYYEEEIVA